MLSPCFSGLPFFRKPRDRLSSPGFPFLSALTAPSQSPSHRAAKRWPLPQKPLQEPAVTWQQRQSSNRRQNSSGHQKEQFLPESKRGKEKGGKWLFLSMAFYPRPCCSPESPTPNHHLVKIASNWRV